MNAEHYRISVQRVHIDGEDLYEARIAELPDVREYADTAEEARALALDTIDTTQAIFRETGRAFPKPSDPTVELPSGRVTLRLPRSLHGRVLEASEGDGVSLNTWIVSALSSACGWSTHREYVAQWVSAVGRVRVAGTQVRRREAIPMLEVHEDSAGYGTRLLQ